MNQPVTPEGSEPQNGDHNALPIDIPKKAALSATCNIALLVLAIFYTLYFAASLLIPIAFAVLLNVIFSPVSRSLLKRGIPAPLSAAMIVILLMVSMAFSIVMLSNPVADWIDRLPSVAWKIENKLQDILQPVESVKEITTQMGDIANSATADDANKVNSTVEIKGPSFSDQLFSSIQSMVLQLSIVGVLLFFLLASGDLFKERFMAMMPGLKGKKQILTIMKKIEKDASTYLLTMCAISFVLGIAIGTALWLLGIPNAVLWGFMAFVLNFIPYVGAIVGAGIVFMVALLSQESLSIIIAAPLIYIGFSFIEGQFFTPAILGRKLTISPVIVFLSVLFWGWLWGVPGAVMAVPILVIFRAFCDNIEGLHLVSLFLGGKTEQAK